MIEKSQCQRSQIVVSITQTLISSIKYAKQWNEQRYILLAIRCHMQNAPHIFDIQFNHRAALHVRRYALLEYICMNVLIYNFLDLNSFFRVRIHSKVFQRIECPNQIRFCRCQIEIYEQVILGEGVISLKCIPVGTRSRCCQAFPKRDVSFNTECISNAEFFQCYLENLVWYQNSCGLCDGLSPGCHETSNTRTVKLIVSDKRQQTYTFSEWMWH